jgi:hypothetical protein
MHGVRAVRFVSTVILVKGVLNTLLGVLHVVGTFTFEARKIAGLAALAFSKGEFQDGLQPAGRAS